MGDLTWRIPSCRHEGMLSGGYEIRRLTENHNTYYEVGLDWEGLDFADGIMSFRFAIAHHDENSWV